MKVKELMEYLSLFGEDKKMGFIIGNLDAGKFYPCTEYDFVKDDEVDYPVIIFEVGKPKSREEVKAEYGEE